MKANEFMDCLDVHIRELESVADDLDELANECQSDYMEQALLNKAARIYDVLAAIRYDRSVNKGAKDEKKSFLVVAREMCLRGSTQPELANMTAIDRVSINRILRGREQSWPKYQNKIANALGWTGNPADLFKEVSEHGK